MPLIKNGRVVEDRYVRILDDAPIPEGVCAIVPAARFLADAEDILRRDAPTGVEWPNNRKVTELEPYLDRLAVIVLAFPNFKDGTDFYPALSDNFFVGNSFPGCKIGFSAEEIMGKSEANQ